MRFADFHPGQLIETGPCRLTKAEVLDFARAWDPQWFHTDPDAAAGGRFKGLIASGWQTCGIAMRLVALGILRWRWQLFNQNQVEVLDLEATRLLELPIPETPTP